jgi:guanylate kinase
MKLGPRKGIIFVLSAPSGCGKTTLANELIKHFEGELFRAITCTTRQARPLEVDGVDYHFISEEEFSDKVLKNEFLEYTKSFKYSYGTLKKNVDELKTKGCILLVIDVKGKEALSKEYDIVSIFLLPPNLKELERRIRLRGEMDEKELNLRLTSANLELEKAKLYDYNVVNDNFALALEQIEKIIVDESFRRK